MASASRFRTTSAAEQEERRLNLNAEKTLKANKFASKIFKEYLTEKGGNADFETFLVSDLDNALGRFYMDLRRVDGTSCKITSMEGIRHGINRYLKNPPFNKRFDIIKDSEFVGSNINFKAVLVELKRTGKGDVVHYPVITEADLQKLYSNLHMNTDTPQGLFNKVKFDVRLYFCRRGNENMHSMSKSTFNIEVDSESGLKYVKKIQDELTKNHRIDKESTSGVMPETPAQEEPSDVPVKDDDSDLYYDCNGKGYLLILNSMNNRTGTKADVDRLSAYFGDELHFKVHDPRSNMQDDLSTNEVFAELDKVRSELDSGYYCFICVILSHGNENGIQTRTDFIREETIRHKINNRNTPNFTGRPKIFLIQACRGEQKDKMRTDNIEQFDDEGESPNNEEQNRYIEIPTDADALFAFSSTPGFVSVRYEKSGSWFIGECIQVFKEYYKRLHFEDMLIIMKQRVANKKTEDGMKQMPCVWSTLTKRLMLRECKRMKHK